MKKSGILFALLGVTNLGKTTQQELLMKRLTDEGHKVVYVKYPRYDLEPTGPRINAYMRKGNPEGMTPQEFHKLQIQNKKDFEPELEGLLEAHDIVLAEMYTGTGITYAMGDGLDKAWIVEQYAPLREADVSILLDGQRFLASREAGHIFEDDDAKTELVRQAHLELAQDFGWHVVNANGTIPEVHEAIYQIVAPKLA